MAAYNHVGTPNTRACNNWVNRGNLDGVDVFGTAPPNSNHGGGVNLCLADGAVQFIKDSIDQQAWWALGTRAGGEALGDGSY